MKNKKLFSILMVLVISLSLFACGEKDKLNKPYDYDLSEYVTLGEYKGVSYEAVTVKEVTEDDIKNEIYAAIDDNDALVYTKITDRPAELGDTVNIDYQGILDGVAFEGGTAKGADLTLGSGQFIDGFEEGLVGATIGQEVALNLTFPEKYHNDDLAGKAVVFNVKVNSITNVTYPEINDDLVSKISDYSNLADYKAYIKSYLQAENKISAENSNKALAWNAAKSNAKVIKLPEKEKNYYINDIKNAYESTAKAYNMTLEDLLKNGYNTTLDEFEKYCEETAVSNVETDMIAIAIYRDAKLEMSKEDREDAISYLMSVYGVSTEDELMNIYDDKSYIESKIIYLYVVDYLVENAVVA